MLMKKIFLLLCLFPSLLFALPQNGLYKGYGTWINDGGLGDRYEVDIYLKDTSLSSEYFENDNIHKRTFQFSALSENFDLIMNSKKVGEGHCKIDTCELSWMEGNDELKEILFFEKNKIKRSGKRISSGRWVTWQEDLNLM